MMSSNTSVRVTIGMPVYNAGALIRDALDSLLAQTYSKFELIISDNASTDDTESIAREYVAKDSRIRYVRQSINRGGPWNFNEVFRLSNNEYFKWAAYDDICHPTYLARCVEVLDAHPEVVWCHSLSRHIDLHGDPLLGSDTPAISYLSQPLDASPSTFAGTRASDRPADRFRAVLLGRLGCLDSYGLIRATALRKTALFLPCFGSEKVLMATLGLLGKYHEIPDVLFYARIHERAAGNQKSEKLQQQFVNPLARRSTRFARWKLLSGYVSAIYASPLSWRERQRCYAAIGRYLFQVHKWKSVFVKTFTGAGLAGEYPALLSHNRSAKAC